MKGMLRLTILEAAIAIALLRIICEPLQATAQLAPDKLPSVLLAYDSSPATGSPSTGIGSGAIRYIPPAGDPPRSGGVGTIRGLCGSQGRKPGLRALVPLLDASGQPVKVARGQTVSDHPTFWFDVPYSSNDDLDVEFVLQDRNDEDIYRTNVTLPKAPGIISIQVPAMKPALQSNEWYLWTLQVKCKGAATSDKNDVVQGWIQRTTLLDQGVIQKIKEADPRKKAALYAENRIWFEALTILGNALKAKPNDVSLMKDWKALLESAGLQETTSKTPSQMNAR